MMYTGNSIHSPMFILLAGTGEQLGNPHSIKQLARQVGIIKVEFIPYRAKKILLGAELKFVI